MKYKNRQNVLVVGSGEEQLIVYRVIELFHI